jgi:hypothetical protein
MLKTIVGLFSGNTKELPLLVDILLLIAAGSLASFLFLFMSRQPLDMAIFYAGLNFDSISADSASDDKIQVTNEVTLGVVVSDDAFLETKTRSLEAWTSDTLDTLNNFLGRSLIQGRLTEDSLVLDRNSAQSLNVSIGDSILLSTDTTSSSEPCFAYVTGIVRSFHNPEKPGDGGLLVAGNGVCPDVIASGERGPEIAINPPTGGTSKWVHVLRQALAFPGLAAGTLTISVFGLILWYFAVHRVVSRLTRERFQTYALLSGLGAPIRLMDRIGGSMNAVLVLASSTVSTMIAGTLLRGTAHLYVQPGHIVLGALLIALVGFWSARNARRMATNRLLLEGSTI